MKNVFKFFTLGLMLSATIGAASTSIFAQTDCDATYEAFKVANKGTTVDDKNKALDLAKKYLADEKCNTPETQDIVVYLKKQVDAMPGRIKAIQDKVIIDRFNASIPAKNWDDAFASGKQVMTLLPDAALDIAITLAEVGFDRVTEKTPIDKYNSDTIQMAKYALDHIDSKSDKYGLFGTYELKNAAFSDGKANTIGWMNYIIGYITYERLKNQKDALPYFYKATQANSWTKSQPIIYKEIGEWYLSEFNRIGTEREAKIQANGGKDNEETLALLAQQKGYADRALDAYIRAYNIAPATNAAYKTQLKNRTKEIYSVRYDKPDNFEKDVAVMPTTPFPDPTSTVTPIVDAPPATTGETTPATTAPANTTGAKTATTPAKKPTPKN